MPRLDLGAVRATLTTILRHLDTWTLSTLNSPALNSPVLNSPALSVLAADSQARAARY
ncbi:hypothetical protein [Actinoplanes sp. NPDC051494]|uniref:hypothetical protein n=1 Tax=Actinoplanes sp. NPDC051494 TaxID=3363907 RepID=UPI0037B842A1